MGNLGPITSFGLAQDAATCATVFDSPSQPDKYLEDQCSSRKGYDSLSKFLLSPHIPYPPPKTFDANKYADVKGAKEYGLQGLVTYYHTEFADPGEAPGSWFELYYSKNCDGKPSCSVPIHMLPNPKDSQSTKKSVWTYSDKC